MADYLAMLERINSDISENEAQQAVRHREINRIDLDLAETDDILKIYRIMLDACKGNKSNTISSERLSIQFKITQREMGVTAHHQTRKDLSEQLLSLERKHLKLCRERAPLLERVEQACTKMESRRAHRICLTQDPEASPTECPDSSGGQHQGDNGFPPEIRATETSCHRSS